MALLMMPCPTARTFGTYGGANRPEETAHFLADLVKASPYGGDGFYVYVGNGTNDAVYSQPHNQSLARPSTPKCSTRATSPII